MSRDCCEEPGLGADLSFQHEGDHVEVIGECMNCEAVHKDVFTFSRSELVEEGTALLPPDVWDAIQFQVAQQGLGTGRSVICSECNGQIETGDRARGYIVGKRIDAWKLRWIMHVECESDILCEARIGDHDDHEGIVYGTIQYAPEMEPRIEKEREANKREIEAIWGENAQVYQGDTPKFHLVNLELGKVHIPSNGTFGRVPKEGSYDA